MSPPAASATARRQAQRRPAPRPSARRGRAHRRRRRVLWLGLAALVALLVIVLMPTVKKAVREFTLPLQYQSAIRDQAAEKHVDAALIAAVIYAETKFEPRVSAAGAEGPMQVMPQTALYLAHRSGATTFHVSDLNTPAINIAYGTYYLRELLDHFGGSELLAVAAYNGGEANVDRWVVAARAAGHPLTVSEIPFPETQAYVEKVLHAQKEYRRVYASQLGY